MRTRESVAVTNEEMRLADARTIEGGVPSLTLMERAGRAIAKIVAENGSGEKIVVACGSGNNGGDGYVAARYLREWGFPVSVWAVGAPKSEDCKAVAALWKGETWEICPVRKGVLVDCLFGTGLARPLEGKYLEAVRFINEGAFLVYAADIPSGLNGDNGQIMGEAVKADHTISIAYRKVGTLLADGIDRCGTVHVVDIGIETQEGYFVLYGGESIQFLPQRRRNVHKGTFGMATLVAGSLRYSGAALLGIGALRRMGAGYTRLVTDREVLPHYIGRYPDVLLSAWDEEIVRSKAVAIGSGMGVSEELYAHIRFLLERYEGTLVIDADGLNALALYGKDVLKEKKCAVVLTPHIKEFARLTGKSVSEILADPIGEAKGFASAYGVTLLLKSAVSVVTDGRQTALNATGNASLAKGGSGDVLTGIVCGLALTLSPYESALYGAYLLGLAAEEASARLGIYASTATDVVEALPAVLRRCTEEA